MAFSQSITVHTAVAMATAAGSWTHFGLLLREFINNSRCNEHILLL